MSGRDHRRDVDVVSDWNQGPGLPVGQVASLISGFSVMSTEIAGGARGIALLMQSTSRAAPDFAGKVLRAPGCHMAGPVMADDGVGRRVRDLAEGLEGERAGGWGRERRCGSQELITREGASGSVGTTSPIPGHDGGLDPVGGRPVQLTEGAGASRRSSPEAAAGGAVTISGIAASDEPPQAESVPHTAFIR